MGLDNTVLGGVFLSLSHSEERFVLISGHTTCTSLHNEIVEVEKESSPKLEEEVFIATLGAPTQTSEAKRTKPKLTSKLNNKATNAKLESATYLATQTKQCD